MAIDNSKPFYQRGVSIAIKRIKRIKSGKSRKKLAISTKAW